MYIAKVPNRNSPPAILIRESYREGGAPKTRTVANISKWKPARIEALRQLLKGNVDLGEAQQFEITRSKPHGHVAAVLGTLRKVGLERIIHSRQRRERDLVVAMIVARIVEPGSKLATARGLSKQTLTSSLGECVGVEDTNEDELYDSLDWLLSRQAAIEKKLAKRHLQQGSLSEFELTSFFACSPTTWNGTCEKPSSRSCLTTTTLTVPMPNAHPSSAQQRLQTPPRQRLLPRRLRRTGNDPATH